MTSFNVETKYNGFFRLTMGDLHPPELLSMGPWVMNYAQDGEFWGLNNHSYAFGRGMIPLKARDKNIWIVRRSSPVQAPNYFWTTNLKSYNQITNFQPQEKYNWLTTELVTYPQLDGTLSQGILYKPEDFDKNKKYPLLIMTYEQFSYWLYGYPVPDFSEGEINIAWFVSNGYLVFTPDYHFDQFHWGDKVLNSVVGATQWLSKLPFVNPQAIGINGNSQGGAQVNYLVTHSHLFAAAVQGSAGSRC